MGNLICFGGLYEGLSLAVAIRMASHGTRVIFVSRHPSERPQSRSTRDQATVEEFFQSKGWPYHIVRYRPGDEGTITEAVATIGAQLTGSTYCFLGDGAPAYPYTKVSDLSFSDWKKSVDYILLGGATIITSLLNDMRETGHGRIVNVSYNDAYWSNHLYYNGSNPLCEDSVLFRALNDARSEILHREAMFHYGSGILINTVEAGRISRVDFKGLFETARRENYNGGVINDSIDFADYVCENLFLGNTPITCGRFPLLNHAIRFRTKAG